MRAVVVWQTLLLATLTAAQDGVAGVVYLIRHGEKVSHEGCLNDAGQARAATLPSIFNGGICEAPTIVFAHNYTAGVCQRCVDFATPLANDRGLAINSDFGSHTEAGNEGAAAAIYAALATNDVILVVWEHHNLPRLAEALLAQQGRAAEVPEEWDDDDFDSIYILVFEPDGEIGFSRAPSYAGPDTRLRRQKAHRGHASGKSHARADAVLAAPA